MVLQLNSAAAKKRSHLFKNFLTKFLWWLTQHFRSSHLPHSPSPCLPAPFPPFISWLAYTLIHTILIHSRSMKYRGDGFDPVRPNLWLYMLCRRVFHYLSDVFHLPLNLYISRRRVLIYISLISTVIKIKLFLTWLKYFREIFWWSDLRSADSHLSSEMLARWNFFHSLLSFPEVQRYIFFW